MSTGLLLPLLPVGCLGLMVGEIRRAKKGEKKHLSTHGRCLLQTLKGKDHNQGEKWTQSERKTETQLWN